MKTLVLGMGNPILSDDAIGIRLAGDLRRLLEQHRTVEARGAGEKTASDASTDWAVDLMEDCSVGGLNLLDVVVGYDRLIVFDSIRTADGVPGAWYAMTGTTFQETMNLGCVHDANFTTALELGRQTGAHLPKPDDVHIAAVEIVDNTTFSETMTPLLEKTYPQLSREITDWALGILSTSTTTAE